MAFEYWLTMVIFCAVAWYVLAPVFTAEIAAGVLTVRGKENLIEDLRLRKEEVLLTLKDLELDYKMRKISEQDYKSLFDEAFQQGAGLVRQIDNAAGGPEASVLPAPVANTVQQGSPKYCIHCGTALQAGAKFCGECGQKVV